MTTNIEEELEIKCFGDKSTTFYYKSIEELEEVYKDIILQIDKTKYEEPKEEPKKNFTFRN